jgi:hypothetical protein
MTERPLGDCNRYAILKTDASARVVLQRAEYVEHFSYEKLSLEGWSPRERGALDTNDGNRGVFCARETTAQKRLKEK